MPEIAGSALPRSATLSRIPSLDGLRTLSILLVVCFHTLQRFDSLHRVKWYWYGLFSGGSGVFIFFEISGFLITTLLLEEHRKRGSISLRGFYLRRAFRILPPLYLYLGVVVLLGLWGRLSLWWSSVLSATFFYHNVYAPGDMWSIEHLWSISLEEQFYLVWPFVLVYCLRRALQKGRRAAALFPVWVIAVSPLLRVGFLMFKQPALHNLGILAFRFDFMMFGCLVALLQGTPRFEAMYAWATRVWWAAPAVVLVSNLMAARFAHYFELTIGYTVEGAAIAVFMLWCTRNAGSGLGILLNLRPVAWVGVLSYSIYLWQTLWLHDGNERALGWLAPLGRFPWNWAGFMVTAALSYYVIERPSLNARAAVIRALYVYRQRALRTNV